MKQDGFRNITLHQLEALIRLVETGSFTPSLSHLPETVPPDEAPPALSGPDKKF
jgi:hypothetical protein